MTLADIVDPAPKGPVTDLAKAVADRVADLLRIDLTAGDDMIVDTKAAARICGLSTRTLEKMRSDGEGPVAIRITGASVGYRLGALRDWLRARPCYGRRALASALANADFKTPA
jgi:predicted DNA-binding transcriptional regulator AlpA